MILSQIALSLAQVLALSSVHPATEEPVSPSAQDLVVQSEPSDAQLLRQAQALAVAGNREDALRIYNRMLERSPGNSDARLARGRTFAWMERWEEAEDDLRAVVEQSPGYADAWSALGDLYLWSDRPGQAVTAYDRWTRLAPDEPAALVARGRAHRATGNMGAARADFEAARRQGGNTPQIDREMASLSPRVRDQAALGPLGYTWSTRIGASHTSFSPERDAWNDQELSLRRHFTRGSVALEFLRAQRFDRRGSALALDAYAPLWQRAYANIRYQNSIGNHLLADQAWRVEVFQDAALGWELSGSYDHLDFGTSTDIYGIGIGRYVGNFYARYKALHVAGSSTISHRALLRNYYAGNGDDYFEIAAGSGRENEDVAFGRPVRTSSSSFTATFVRYFQPQWGLKLTVGHARDVDGFDERRVSASVLTRW
ncbi:YaiO family outer membrane beta-barrel protein [Lysobacter sp. A3-1-A15]|uniref:YaiO family outer membrane beta-barrel protein n=1 Tax=Novilysobacter viscosus TaxID=3098602 RepID=UPI002EDB1697